MAKYIERNLRVVRGDSWTYVISVKDKETGSLMDFTDWSATFSVGVSDYTVTLSEGQITLSLTSGETAALTEEVYPFTVVLTNPSSKKQRWLTGNILVKA